MPPNLNNCPIENKRKKRKRKKNQKKKNSTGNIEQNSTQSNVWKKTYENLTKWHTHHQLLYWKGLAERFQQQNQILLKRLEQQNMEQSQIDVCLSEESEASDSGSDDEPETTVLLNQNHLELEFDEEYLNFLEITRKHREELKLQRENDIEVEAAK
ncbi:hypothetical protein ACFFRR_004209 [Megaselia abdita]